ncbi:MAG: hypothetical protein M1819_005655 [Sarea resinae]|nr:MAG: hypothetical protein M1819_005655 [Sarea resinae]
MESVQTQDRASIRDVTAYLVCLLFVSAMGPLQFGFHLAELNAPQEIITCEKKSIRETGQPKLPQCIPMNATMFGLVSSIFTLGGLLGALAAGPCATRFGRLPTMRATTAFFVAGPLFAALSSNVGLMAAGRFLAGLGAGAAVVVVPIFISEVAPPKEKGVFGALTQVMINVGILIAQLLGYFLSYGQYWRIILAVAGGLGLVQLAGLLIVPESPKWLADHGRAQKAKKSLRKIRGRDIDIEEEVSGWGAENAEERDEEEEALIDSRTDRRINSIVMYSVSLLSDLLKSNAALLTVVVSAINLVATVACAPLVDILGRKPCLLLSIAGMGINALLIAVSIIRAIPILSAVATLFFVASFAIGLGPVPFILASELVGPEAVGATQSWALAANWIATFLVAQFFPVLNSKLGKGKIYFLFAGLAALFFAFVVWWVPETKGKRDVDEVWGRERRDD